MATMSLASRKRLVTSLLAQVLFSLVHVAHVTAAASGDVEACAGVRPEVGEACKKCADVPLATCCADTGVLQQCLRSLVNTTTLTAASDNKHSVLVEGDDDIEKRARPFLGKRSEEEESQLEEDHLMGDAGNKRARPFLGKRTDAGDHDLEQLDEKRARPFLGKRSQENNDEESYSSEDLSLVEEKRARPFLGKREQQMLLDQQHQQQHLLRYGTFKRPRPFLGKRIIDGTEALGMEQDKRARPFLGKRAVDELATISRVKRARPFLGKRVRPFLGKRDGSSNEREAERLFSELLSSQDKRARPFLG